MPIFCACGTVIYERGKMGGLLHSHFNHRDRPNNGYKGKQTRQDSVIFLFLTLVKVTFWHELNLIHIQHMRRHSHRGRR